MEAGFLPALDKDKAYMFTLQELRLLAYPWISWDTIARLEYLRTFQDNNWRLSYLGDSVILGYHLKGTHAFFGVAY